MAKSVQQLSDAQVELDALERLLVRDSQDGTSTWQPENMIYQRIQGLVEVRKK